MNNYESFKKIKAAARKGLEGNYGRCIAVFINLQIISLFTSYFILLIPSGNNPFELIILDRPQSGFGSRRCLCTGYLHLSAAVSDFQLLRRIRRKTYGHPRSLSVNDCRTNCIVSFIDSCYAEFLYPAGLSGVYRKTGIMFELSGKLFPLFAF